MTSNLTLSFIRHPCGMPAFFRRISFLFCLFILPLFPAEAQNASLADRFYIEGRYELAFIEYSRLSDKKPALRNLSEKKALSLMGMNRHRESVPFLIENTFSSRYLRAYAYMNADLVYNASSVLNESFSEFEFSENQQDRFRFLGGTLYLQEGNLNDAQYFYEQLAESGRTESIRNDSREMSEAIKDFKSRPVKSPLLAGFFSALLPGSGQIYAGHTIDGIRAFAYTGTAAAFAGYINRLESRSGKDRSGSIAMGVIALILYSANVYGAGASAKRYNAFQKRSFHNNIKNRFFSLDRAEEAAEIEFSAAY